MPSQRAGKGSWEKRLLSFAYFVWVRPKKLKKRKRGSNRFAASGGGRSSRPIESFWKQLRPPLPVIISTEQGGKKDERGEGRKIPLAPTALRTNIKRKSSKKKKKKGSKMRM